MKNVLPTHADRVRAAYRSVPEREVSPALQPRATCVLLGRKARRARRQSSYPRPALCTWGQERVNEVVLFPSAGGVLETENSSPQTLPGTALGCCSHALEGRHLLRFRRGNGGWSSAAGSPHVCHARPSAFRVAPAGAWPRAAPPGGKHLSPE